MKKLFKFQTRFKAKDEIIAHLPFANNDTIYVITAAPKNLSQETCYLLDAPSFDDEGRPFFGLGLASVVVTTSELNKYFTKVEGEE